MSIDFIKIDIFYYCSMNHGVCQDSCRDYPKTYV